MTRHDSGIIPSVSDLESSFDDHFCPKPPVKTRPRDAHYEASRSRYRAAVSAALANGWTFRALARRADCSVQHVIECFEMRRNPGDWMFVALPEPSQRVDIDKRIRALKLAGGRNVA